MSASDIKSRALTILSGGSAWCQGAGARDENDLPTSPLSGAAVAWDIQGALTKANFEWNLDNLPGQPMNFSFYHEAYEQVKRAIWPNFDTEPTTVPVSNFNFDMELWNDSADWSELESALS